MTNTQTTIIRAQERAPFKQRSAGVELSILRVHAQGGLTFLVRMARGSRAQRHGHPGGEETYMLSGRVRFEHRLDVEGQPQPDVELAPGDYVFAPPGEVHDGYAEEDALFLVVTPGGLEAPTT